MPNAYPQLVTSRKACEILGLHASTLRRWDRESKIEVVRSVGKKRLYNVKTFIENSDYKPLNTVEKQSVCYCRVSSPKQKDDMERQVAFMREQYPKFNIIEDVGSGINWKRKGLITILQGAFAGRIKTVVVAHRDRLARFGFELLEYIFNYHDVELVVLDKEKHQSLEQELAEDLLAITHIYSCKQMGRRRYSRKTTGGKVPKGDNKKGEKQMGAIPEARCSSSQKDENQTDGCTEGDTSKMDG